MEKECALIKTAIVDSGASGSYFKPGAPVSDINRVTAKICVDTATDQVEESADSCKLPLPGIPLGLFGHVMSGFRTANGVLEEL